MKALTSASTRRIVLFGAVGVLALAAWSQSTPHAIAQEGGGLLDIDIGEIDLGDDSKGGEQSMSYEGQVGQDADNYKPGTPVYITHTKGNISVRCTDSPGIQARVNFTVEGTKESAMQSLGDRIGIRTYASNSQGKVSTSVPGKYSGIDAIYAPLTVNLPREARIHVTGGGGWVQVVGCTGTVKATTRGGGIYVDGILSSFDLSTNMGDIEIELDAAAELTSTSRASATAGSVLLRMPITQKGNLNARGEEITVDHLVNGTNSPTHVQGTLSDSGPSISITAKTKVTITTPN
jgi:hypothetical protein